MPCFSVNCCPPPDAGSFAKRLLDVLFTEEELARSCCTKATGRELLNQTVLVGIKCMLAICSDFVPNLIMYNVLVGRPNILQVPSTKGPDRREMEQDSA